MSSRTSPQSIGSLTQSTGKNGSLSQGNSQDVILFEVMTPINLEILASRYVLFGSSGVVLSVAKDLDNDGQLDSNEIFSEQILPSTDTNVSVFEQNLNPGRYFIEYDATAGNSYQVGYFSDLVVSGGGVVADNAGNTLTAAYTIGSLSGSRTFSDFVGSNDTND